MKQRSRRYHRRRDAWAWAKAELKRLMQTRRKRGGLLRHLVRQRMEETRRQR